MPDAKLQAYLAQHYLSGPKADAILARQEQQEGGGETRKRKKRRRHEESGSGSGSGSTSGLRLRDDSDDWKRRDVEDDDEKDATAVKSTNNDRKEKFHKGGFRGIDADGLPLEDSPDEAPLVASITDESGSAPAPVPVPAPSGARSGLRTKEQVRAERLAREAAERRESELAQGHSADDDDDAARLAQTTVHRDATGRKINIEAEEAEQRLEAERQRHRAHAKRQANRGEAQRAQEAQQRAELQQVQSEGVARYADDKRMNEQLRAVERADDPALAFLTKKRDTKPHMPKYKGPPPPPNRFGIPPGHRWDGVVRGNGFEKKIFEARGERSRREQDARVYDSSEM